MYCHHFDGASPHLPRLRAGGRTGGRGAEAGAAAGQAAGPLLAGVPGREGELPPRPGRQLGRRGPVRAPPHAEAPRQSARPCRSAASRSARRRLRGLT